MKRTSKVISIILSVFMLMQMMTGIVSANSYAPTNLRWITGEDLGLRQGYEGTLAWDAVPGYDYYYVYIYKNGELVDTVLVERDEQYDFGYETIMDFMKIYGAGSYTVKVATYGGTLEEFDNYIGDSDKLPVLGVSEMSVPYEYTGDKTVNANNGETVKNNTESNSGNEDAANQPQNSESAIIADGEIECPLAVKVCYDLGIMPNVYENADKIVTYDEFVELFQSFTGDIRMPEKKSDNITVEQICGEFCRYGGLNTIYYTAVNGALYLGYLDGVHLYREVNITHAQLAKIIYNVLNGKKIEKVWRNNGYVDEKVNNGALFEHGYVKYQGDVSVSGDKATVSGKLYNRENCYGTDIKDVVLNISDKDLKSGSDYLLFVKDDTIVSAISAVDADAEKITKDMTPPTVITLTIGDVNATVNGKSVSNDVAPIVVNDRTMLPIRFVAEALGAEVGWNEYSQSVSINWPKKVYISIKIGSNYASVEENLKPEEQVKLDSPAFVENGRTYLPLRFVAEKLGADVQWDGATRTITIIK